MIAELVLAFVLMFIASFTTYLFGCLLSIKSRRSGNGKSAYACGEKMNFSGLKVNISYYRYLVYFVVLDSSVLLMAFASLAFHMANILLFMIYIITIFVSGLLLLEGGGY
jgi:NADH:ubiquinone oxidoreductase subunit 3 (subunit A)